MLLLSQTYVTFKLDLHDFIMILQFKVSYFNIMNTQIFGLFEIMHHICTTLRKKEIIIVLAQTFMFFIYIYIYVFHNFFIK